MVNKLTLCLPPLRGSREEGEVGAPRTPPTWPKPSASRSCLSWVSTMDGACQVCAVGDVCRSVFVFPHVLGELWGQAGQGSRGPLHPIPGVGANSQSLGLRAGVSLWGNTLFDLLDLGLLAFRPHRSEPCSKGPLWLLGASERLSSSVWGCVPASLVRGNT